MDERCNAGPKPRVYRLDAQPSARDSLEDDPGCDRLGIQRDAGRGELGEQHSEVYRTGQRVAAVSPVGLHGRWWSSAPHVAIHLPLPIPPQGGEHQFEGADDDFRVFTDAAAEVT